MTTLAVIGGGIAGRSLIYALAKQEKTFSRILLFDKDAFARTCSLRSTAIVAPRGLSAGHSELGDLLMDAYQTFSQHVSSDSPEGVFKITQYTSAHTRLDQFSRRYPEAELKKDLAPFSYHELLLTSLEPAFLIDTEIYLNWLLDSSQSLAVTVRDDFVIGIQEDSLQTHSGESFHFDHLVFAGGAHNQNFPGGRTAKIAQGSYLEFQGVDYGPESFSLTLEGDNLIYHAHSKKLLLGSTTLEVHHEWPQRKMLSEIYSRVSSLITLPLPELEDGKVLTGLREKAPKRAPYLVSEGSFSHLGGYYKNGYSLGLHLGRKLAQQLVRNA